MNLFYINNENDETKVKDFLNENNINYMYKDIWYFYCTEEVDTYISNKETSDINYYSKYRNKLIEILVNRGNEVMDMDYMYSILDNSIIDNEELL